MRELIVNEYVSVDGVIQAPGHAGEDRDGGFRHGGWTGPLMDEHRRYMTEALAGAGGLLLGRRTYEIFAGYWPTVRDESDEIAQVLNSAPKYVVSRTLTEPPWGPATVIDRDVPREVRRLKHQPGKDVFVIGSSGLAQTLIANDLVDEYRLWVHPVVLGGGKKLFYDGSPTTTVTLVDARATSGGLVMLTYRRRADHD